MCLVGAKIKETIEDIICYKVYKKHVYGLVSPYRSFSAPKMNEVIKTHLEEPCGKGKCVDRGFHSFASLEDAIKESKNWVGYYNFNPVIVRCIIPKDSKCYVGSFSGKTSYCSESIILKEIINVE